MDTNHQLSVSRDVGKSGGERVADQTLRDCSCLQTSRSVWSAGGFSTALGRKPTALCLAERCGRGSARAPRCLGTTRHKSSARGTACL